MNKLFSFIFFYFLGFYAVIGQSGNAYVGSIHPMEPIDSHYKELSLLNNIEREEFKWMDSISFPAELYLDNAILLAMSEPSYLTNDQVEYLKKSVRFPANSSEQTRAELDFLLDIQNNRTNSQSKRVMEIGDVGYWPNANYLKDHLYYSKNLEHLFFESREVLGESYHAGNYPKTSALLENIMIDMRIIEFAIKFHLLRARPYQLEPKLKPLKEIKSPSFASGHTLWAYIQAYTFAELIPSKRKEFLELAYEIGYSREIMGVHYPSDEEAARQIAHRMLYLMWHSSEFQQDFRAAQQEWQSRLD